MSPHLRHLCAFARLTSVAILASFLLACSTPSSSVRKDDHVVAPSGSLEQFYNALDRHPVGDLEGPSVADGNRTVNLNDYSGKIVAINIWASWCGPCVKELPELEEAQRQSGQKFQLLGINVRDNSDFARDFNLNSGLTFPSMFDPSGRTLLAFSGYPRNVVPTTIIVDRKRRVAALFIGTVSTPRLLSTIDRIGAE